MTLNHIASMLQCSMLKRIDIFSFDATQALAFLLQLSDTVPLSQLYCWPPVCFGISCINWQFLFLFANRLIQTSKTGGQQYSDTSPFSIPWSHNIVKKTKLTRDWGERYHTTVLFGPSLTVSLAVLLYFTACTNPHRTTSKVENSAQVLPTKVCPRRNNPGAEPIWHFWS